MTRLAEIEAQIGSMADLLGIVGAMRSLAGMRRQEAVRALPDVRGYAGDMAAAIADVFLLLPQPAAPAGGGRGRRAVVLFLAEHGFVGGFSERLIEVARARAKPRDVLMILGSRGAAQAVEHGLPAAWTSPAPTRSAGAVEAARRVADELYRRIARDGIDRVEMVYARYRAQGGPAAEIRTLLPIDPEPLRLKGWGQAPMHNLDPATLLEMLVAEYVFAQLTEAAVESIASENETRLTTMEAARDNVSKKLERLRQTARHARQAEITTELLDLVTGADALQSPASSGRSL